MDVLASTLDAFDRHIKTSHGLRFIIVEDKLEGSDAERVPVRDAWLSDYGDRFDVVHYNETHAGYVYAYAHMLPHLRSPVFFRLDDDTPFVEDVEIDPLIEFLLGALCVCQCVFRRTNANRALPVGKSWSVGGRLLHQSAHYSVSTGLHLLGAAREIVKAAGGKCHESMSLSPAMRRRGSDSSIVLGLHQEGVVYHAGEDLGYVKGSHR